MAAEKICDDIEKLSRWRQCQATLSFVLYAATQSVYPGSRLRIEHSISHGFYCSLDRKLRVRDIRRLEWKMRDIIAEDLPIMRLTLPKKKALALFRRVGLKDKIDLLENTRIQQFEVYRLDRYFDHYAVPPGTSTGAFRTFYLRSFPPGFIMVFPEWSDPGRLPRYNPQPRMSRIFNEYLEWVQILGVADVGQLNRAVHDNRGPVIIKVSEALHEKKIVYLADRIRRESRRIVLIAGPSSAGKTTFTKRLAIQLMVNGLKPIMLSVDDYFLPHSQTPRDEFGRLDFESICTVDIPYLNRDLLRIIKGQKVVLPKFSFKTGRRSKGDCVELPKNGVVLVEGIHCLNEELTPQIPPDIKFKIYISALTQLNIDDHNRVSTTDTRMIRRIIRDTRFRGYTASKVLERWGSVRKGEERNIYPHQEQADEMFNSALIYEPSVMKRHVVPLLKAVRPEEPYYEECQRIIDFFRLFSSLDDRDVPSNSILREFIGGSSFVY